MSHLCDMSARADIRAVTAENVRCALLLLSSKGQHCPFAGDNKREIRRKCCYRHTPHPSALGTMSTEFVIAHTPMPFGMGAPHPSPIGDTFPSQHLTFGQVRKASLRIKILCQHNKCKAKSNSDHRNSISRERSPQARPSEFVFHGNARRRRDHRDSYFTGMPAARRSSGCRRRLCRE